LHGHLVVGSLSRSRMRAPDIQRRAEVFAVKLFGRDRRLLVCSILCITFCTVLLGSLIHFPYKTRRMLWSAVFWSFLPSWIAGNFIGLSVSHPLRSRRLIWIIPLICALCVRLIYDFGSMSQYLYWFAGSFLGFAFGIHEGSRYKALRERHQVSDDGHG